MDNPISLNELSLYHERVDDIPLLFGMIEQLKLPEVLDLHLKNHKFHQGLSNGWLASLWLIYILSQGNHRKCSVQKWAEQHQHTLEKLLGRPIRPNVELNDDRLEGLLLRLSKQSRWEAVEAALWQSTLVVYDVPIQGVRLDGTTTCGYHQSTPGGLMQCGYSKDHRPDLGQVKIMAACALPSGFPLASNVTSGEKPDDRLYLPLIDRVREVLGRTGLLYSGDCKMAAIGTRADIVARGDEYLVALPMTGETASLMQEWISAVVDGEQTVELFYDEKPRKGKPSKGQLREEPRLLGAGYEFERPMKYETEICEETTNYLGVTISHITEFKKTKWTERVQVIRSIPLAEQQKQSLAQRLNLAETALLALTPLPGKGRRRFQEEAPLQEAIAKVLQKYKVEGLLEVYCERQEEVQRRYVGTGRPKPNSPTREDITVRYELKSVTRNKEAITGVERRLGWRAQATSIKTEQMSLSGTIHHYRMGSCLENDFHMFKDEPLGISPLYVRRDDQIAGLTNLLMLGLRILMLIQMQVRACLSETKEPLRGLYDGQPSRSTLQPTAVRLLKVIAEEETTLTRISWNEVTRWMLTPLPELLQKVLAFLKLSPTLYTRLTEQGSTISNSLPTDPTLSHLRYAQNSS